MFRSVLALAFCVAAFGLSQIMAAEFNNGTVEYTGEKRSLGTGPAANAAKHVVPDGYVNNGTVTATGKDEEGNGDDSNWYGGSGIWVEAGGFVNSGEVNAFGGKGLMHPNASPVAFGGNGGTGIFVTGDFDNHNTVTAIGGEGKGGPGGNGILVWNGDFNNDGSVTAIGGYGDGAAGGDGIVINSDPGGDFTFINNGEVTATGGASGGGKGGTGINHLMGDFINNGRVTATGGIAPGNNPGSGIFIKKGSFINDSKGYLLARGGSGANFGYGVRIESPDEISGVGFENKGVLVISSPDGGRASLALNNDVQTAIFRSDSTLALLTGGSIDVHADADGQLFTNILTIEEGASLISLQALTLGVDETFRHENFIVNATDVAGSSDIFNSYTTPIMDVKFTNDGSGNYTAAFTRQGFVSDLVDGPAGDYLSAIENLLVDNPDVLNPDDPRFSHTVSYAVAYATVEQQRGDDNDIRDEADAFYSDNANMLYTNARRQIDPQSAATALPSFATGARLAANLFSDRLRLAATMPDAAFDGAPGVSLSGLSGNAYASLSAAGTRHGAVAWATPFHQWGDLDGSSGRGDLRERMGGVALGGALLRGDWAFGLSAHILDVDLAGSGGYDADATGYGLNLGLARRFCLGSLAPWFELTGGYTWYDFDQKRRGVDLLGNPETYRSDPGVHVVNASALLSNAFDFGRFTLTPRIGADYARADMDAYRERGGSTVPRVRSDAYDSFRSVLGAAVSVQATPCIRFEARGDYYHEFADTRSRFAARDSLGLVSVNAHSQDAGRESGRLGVGLHWRPADRVELGLDYDLHLAKNYVGHRFSAQVRLAF